MALTGALPALALMALVDVADAKRPEPHWQLRKVAVLGALAVVPVYALQTWLKGLWPLGGLQSVAFDAFISAALLEEGAKALVLWAVVWRHPAFDERLDGFVYATRAGLGFALVENVASLASTDTMFGFVGTFVLRAFFAVPLHAIAAGFMGDLAARRRFDRKGPGLLGGLAVAVVLHGAYDALLGLEQLTSLPLWVRVMAAAGAPLLVVVGFFVLKGHAARSLALDDADHKHPGRKPQSAAAGYVLRE
jgi:RsiW-degrading membrane proteinase PrsW (M82 family)